MGMALDELLAFLGAPGPAQASLPDDLTRALCGVFAAPTDQGHTALNQ